MKVRLDKGTDKKLDDCIDLLNVSKAEIVRIGNAVSQHSAIGFDSFLFKNFPPKRYNTIWAVWDCRNVRRRRNSLTFERFLELLNKYGAVKMGAVVIYKGAESSSDMWDIQNNKFVLFAAPHLN